MSMITHLVSLWWLLAAVSTNPYNLGLCRPYLTKRTSNTTVTLRELVRDGDFTVLYTSGLKQLRDVSCAKIGYTYNSTIDAYKYYTYVKSDEKEEILEYETMQIVPATFSVLLSDNEYSTQLIKYYGKDILLIYWCKNKGDDNYYNNIWMIAARTPLASSKRVKEAILELLYHDDYQGLIDRDMEEDRDEGSKYVELRTCDQADD